MPGNVATPVGALYVRQGDRLALCLTSALAITANINYYYRMIRASDGQVVDAWFNQNNSLAAGVLLAQEQPLPEGWLIAASIENNTAACPTGMILQQLFVAPYNVEYVGQGVGVSGAVSIPY